MSTPEVTLQLSSTYEHAVGMKELQNANLRRLMDPSIAAIEGFVTAEYEVDFLVELQKVTPAVIAVCEGKVVAYVIAADREASAKHGLLSDMVGQIDSRASFRGKPLRGEPFIVVAQLCIAKEFRGQRLVPRLYQYYADTYRARGFSMSVTTVAKANERSLHAHKKANWETVADLEFNGVMFDVIVLPF